MNAISRANRDRDGALLAGVTPHEVYEAAVTVMMRAVFLLIAEENDLLPVDDPHYQALYSIRRLRESLESERFENPEALETRHHRVAPPAGPRAGPSRAASITTNCPSRHTAAASSTPTASRSWRAGMPGSTWHATVGTPIAVTDFDVLAILDALLVLRFP